MESSSAPAEGDGRGLKTSSISAGKRHGSNSTAYTAESDWETPLLSGGGDGFISSSSHNPWTLFLLFRSAKFLTVEPVAFLYFFTTYLYFPLYEQYFLNRYASAALENTSYPYLNETRCLSRDDVTNYTGDNTTYNREVQGKTSLLFIAVSLANRIPSVLVTLIVGPLSDLYGRRFVMVMVSVGGILQGISAMLIVHFELNVWLFMLSAAFAGLGGDFSALVSSCFSYVSDISQGKWRTVRIAVTESMIFIGGLLAQLGGLWFQKLDCDIIPPLLLFVSCHAVSILYTLLYLPQSLSMEERRRSLSGKRRGLQQLVRGAQLFFCQVREIEVWKLWFALISLVILVINMAGSTSIGVFFFRYLQWSPGKIGAYQAASMGSNAFFLLVGLPILVVLKLPDPLISLVGMIALCLCQAAMGIFTQTDVLFIVAVLQGIAAFVFPPLRSYMSKVVSAEDQGALFSVVASTESLSTLASIGYTYLLPVTIGYHLGPGTAYLIMATLGIIPIPIISILLVHWCVVSRRSGSKVQMVKPLGSTVNEKAPLIQSQSFSKSSELSKSAGYSAPPPEES